MYIEQQLNSAQDGSFFFTTGEKGAIPVMVQTDFTNNELQDIFSITGDGSAWAEFESILRAASFKTSGIARSLYFDQSTHMPMGLGLVYRETAIMRMNVVLTIANLFSGIIENNPVDKYVFFTFHREDYEPVVEVVNRLKEEVNGVFLTHEWFMDVEEAEPGAKSIIDWLRVGN